MRNIERLWCIGLICCLFLISGCASQQHHHAEDELKAPFSTPWDIRATNVTFIKEFTVKSYKNYYINIEFKRGIPFQDLQKLKVFMGGLIVWLPKIIHHSP